MMLAGSIKAEALAAAVNIRRRGGGGNVWSGHTIHPAVPTFSSSNPTEIVQCKEHSEDVLHHSAVEQSGEDANKE